MAVKGIQDPIMTVYSALKWRRWVNEIVKRIALQDNFFGEGGIFTPLIKTIVEKTLSAEIDSFIAQEALKGK